LSPNYNGKANGGMSYSYNNQEDGSDMLANNIAFPQAGQTVIVRNRPALVRSVDERTHPSIVLATWDIRSQKRWICS